MYVHVHVYVPGCMGGGNMPGGGITPGGGRMPGPIPGLGSL